MIKLPNDESKFTQTNTSDLMGNIEYSKNMNFDEPGYAKLSSRSVSLVNERDSTDFDIPTAIGRVSQGTFYIATADSPFISDLGLVALSTIEDIDSGGDAPPSMDFDTHGIFWQNRWHVTTNDPRLYYKTPSNGNWTDAGTATMTSTSAYHGLEVFRNRNTLCLADGNIVRQVNTSYSTMSLDLTIQTDFEVSAMAYNNNAIGIGTRMSSTTEGKDLEAYFFVWDGTTTAANYGYPIGSDAVISVFAFESTWIIQTRTGEFKMFTGSGFTPVTSLPIFTKGIYYGSFLNKPSLGTANVVDGDVFYSNQTGQLEPYGSAKEQYLQSQPGGVWCYDNNIGLYHRYSPSFSSAAALSVLSSGIDTTSNEFTISSGTIPRTGSPIRYIYNGNSMIGGLIIGNIYYCIKNTSNTFKLAETYQDAVNGNVVDITSTGSAANYFFAVDAIDYGASYIDRVGAIGKAGTYEYTYDDILFGCELYDTTGSSYANLCVTVDGFDNLGYFVSSRGRSSGLTDIHQKVFLKWQPLNSSSSITVKMKSKDVLGLPVSTTGVYVSTQPTWTNNTTFTTNADLSSAKTFIDANGSLECEVIAGPGAGQLAQISSITESSGTYTVTLSTELLWISTGDLSHVIIDNWEELFTVTDDDTNCYKEFALDASTGKFAKLKVILKGSNITVEEAAVLPVIDKPMK